MAVFACACSGTSALLTALGFTICVCVCVRTCGKKLINKLLSNNSIIVRSDVLDGLSVALGVLITLGVPPSVSPTEIVGYTRLYYCTNYTHTLAQVCTIAFLHEESVLLQIAFLHCSRFDNLITSNQAYKIIGKESIQRCACVCV